MPLSPLQPGDPAPGFRLPAIHREGEVSLADYRGRSPLLLALFRGIYCPFCRPGDRPARAGRDQARGRRRPDARGRGDAGRPRPSLFPASPGSTTRARRGPRPDDPAGIPRAEGRGAGRADDGRGAGGPDDPGRDPGRALSIPDAARLLEAQHPIELTPLDHADAERQFGQFVGQFLMDRNGIIRWVNIEGAGEGFAGIGAFPTDDELLAAVESSRVAA